MAAALTGDLLAIYGALSAAFGHQHWWPAETAFETMIGAILAQNVAWRNAAQAVRNLDAAGMLDPDRLAAADAGEIACLIVPSRFYNRKAGRIREFARVYVAEFEADPATMAAVEAETLRKRLLAIKGLGKETVDSILLYACAKPVFVVDAYTRRIFSRYGLLPEGASYDRMQCLFAENLVPDGELFKIIGRGFPRLESWEESALGISRYPFSLSPRRGILYAGQAPTETVYAIGDEVAAACVSRRTADAVRHDGAVQCGLQRRLAGCLF